MAQNLTDNWEKDKILTDNWHLPPPIQTLIKAFLALDASFSCNSTRIIWDSRHFGIRCMGANVLKSDFGEGHDAPGVLKNNFGVHKRSTWSSRNDLHKILDPL